MSKNKIRQAATSVVTTDNQPNETTLVVLDSTKTTENETVNTVAEVVEEQREKQPKSIGDIIAKHQRMARALEKRSSIDEASKTLDSFNLGSSKIQDTLTIKDGRGNTFTTTKTDLIGEVIEFLQKRVEVKNAEVEAELLQLETI